MMWGHRANGSSAERRGVIPSGSSRARDKGRLVEVGGALKATYGAYGTYSCCHELGAIASARCKLIIQLKYSTLIWPRSEATNE